MVKLDNLNIPENVIKAIGKDKFIQEYTNLIEWFNNYYTQHEQKYQRLIRLNLICDNGEIATTALNNLDKEAEIKRRRIQELEKLIGG